VDIQEETMTRLKRTVRSAAASLVLAAMGASAAAAQEPLLFWSSQATPVTEAQAMRDIVLPGFGSPVDFQPQDPGAFMTRIQAEIAAGSGQIAVIGGLHGEFASFPDGLADLGDVLKGAGEVAYADLGKLGTGEQKYVPWMQATYIMAANKQALQYLPGGADLNTLTYDQLIAWAKALAEQTGSPKFGLPAGPKGLIHRFVQGTLYPSFTDSMVTKFRSAEAEAMWNKMKELWAVSTPSSPSYDFMQDPLLTGEVWVAWDHVARLSNAFNEKPDDFVAFPSPIGPTGRGFMPVVAGLAVPVSAPDQEASKKLVAYMLQPDTQLKTLRATNFFPVVETAIPEEMPASVKIAGPAIAAQTTAENANPGLLPVGLGELGGQFNKVYIDAFQRILLANQDIRAVLDEQAEALKAVIAQAKAPCWAPDPPSEGPCPVE
jgi:multiple sugar transport system substrate-binding protein